MRSISMALLALSLHHESLNALARQYLIESVVRQLVSFSITQSIGYVRFVLIETH